jgi:predicted DNA-binding transcriptional regulator YafY
MVEVYSYREKSTGTLLYAWCGKDQKIESFRTDRIEHADATKTFFQPRYPIEF